MKRFKYEPSHLSGARVLLRSCNAASVGFLGFAHKNSDAFCVLRENHPTLKQDNWALIGQLDRILLDIHFYA